MEIIVLRLIFAFSVTACSIALDASPLESKILRGSSVPRKSLEFTVLFKKNNITFCSGCLISYKDVLSTAYCVFKIRDLTEGSIVQPTAAYINEKPYEIARTTSCSGYYRTRRINAYNLGQIELDVDSDPVEMVKLMAIAVPVASRFINIVGETATIFGWGRSSDSVPVPQKMQIKIEDDAFCNERIGARTNNHFTEERQMCGSPLKGFQKITQEDSGSPLIYENALVGIVTHRHKFQKQVLPVTVMRVHDLDEYFSTLKLTPLHPEHCLNLIMCRE